MPPFAGQGMCSGIRDVSNLAWKLDLVLGGRADERLLDSYTIERRGHTKAAVVASVKLGRVICVTDAAAAADRDAAIRANGGGRRTSPPEATPLVTGLIQPGGGDVIGAGRFDDLIAAGFLLITTEESDAVSETQRALLSGLGATVVHIGPGEQADGGYLDYLRDRGAASVLVRPDYHVYGTAAAGATAALVEGLLDRLGPHRPSV